jgi:hypothetical protein
MAPMTTSSFDMSRVPVGGWHHPPYGSNTSYALLGDNTQMGAYPTYYPPPMYLSSAMSVPSNTFSMAGPQVPPGLPYGENEFYNSGYPLYGTPLQGGNIYPHSNNPYPTSLSPQTPMMMPVQTSSDHFGMNQHLTGLGQGVHQDPAWLAIFQNQSFPGLWTQMPPSIANLVTISYIGAPSPTSVNHVGDESTSSTNYVDNLPPTSTNYVRGTVLFSPNHNYVASPASIHHTGDDSLFSASYIEKPKRSDVSLNSFARLAKEVTLLICVQLLLSHEENDTPFSHVINIPHPPPSEQERFILPPNALPPSPDEVPFDWDDLMGHSIPPPMSFPLRDIIQTITETVSSISTFSYLTWKALGFPKLLSVIRSVSTL